MRERRRGWRKPDGSVCVTRPLKWANPYGVDSSPVGGWIVCRSGAFFRTPGPNALDPPPHIFGRRLDAQWFAVQLYRAHLLRGPCATLRALARDELGGRDLCCWCKPGEPCHADVLIEIANRDENE